MRTVFNVIEGKVVMNTLEFETTVQYEEWLIKRIAQLTNALVIARTNHRDHGSDLPPKRIKLDLEHIQYLEMRVAELKQELLKTKGNNV